MIVCKFKGSLAVVAGNAVAPLIQEQNSSTHISWIDIYHLLFIYHLIFVGTGKTDEEDDGKGVKKTVRCYFKPEMTVLPLFSGCSCLLMSLTFLLVCRFSSSLKTTPAWRRKERRSESLFFSYISSRKDLL